MVPGINIIGIKTKAVVTLFAINGLMQHKVPDTAASAAFARFLS